MKKRSLILLVTFAIIIIARVLSAQNNPTGFPDVVNKDSICYKYHFEKGDSIMYYVKSYDSILIDYDKPLLKHRYEQVLLTCDSVSQDGRYYLSQILKNFIAKSSQDSLKNIEEVDSPWQGRKIWYAIDSLGKRYAYGVDDSTQAALAPGGAFQPILIIPVGKNCKRINESWNVESLLDLPENGVPVPILRQSLLIRAMGIKDTLDHRSKYLEYISTGQGSMKVTTRNKSFGLTNVTNGYGSILIDIESGVPVNHFATLEQKLTILQSDGSTQPGWHYINTNYRLEYLKRTKKAEPLDKTVPPVKKPKKGRK